MRSTSEHWRCFVTAGVALAVLLVLVPPLPPSSAADEQRRVYDNPIPDGAWLGEMDAVGRDAGTVEGIPATVTARVDGASVFDIVQGSASGDWSWTGLMLVDVEAPQADAVLVAGLRGAGAVGGGDRTLELTGSSTTEGSVVSSAGSQNVGPNVEPIDLDVQVTSASCNTVVGDWISPLDGAIDPAGLDG